MGTDLSVWSQSTKSQDPKSLGMEGPMKDFIGFIFVAFVMMGCAHKSLHVEVLDKCDSVECFFAKEGVAECDLYSSNKEFLGTVKVTEVNKWYRPKANANFITCRDHQGKYIFPGRTSMCPFEGKDPTCPKIVDGDPMSVAVPEPAPEPISENENETDTSSDTDEQVAENADCNGQENCFSCEKTLIERGSYASDLQWCRGVEPTCAKALIERGSYASDLQWCRGVEPTCAKALIERGSYASDLSWCRGAEPTACSNPTVSENYSKCLKILLDRKYRLDDSTTACKKNPELKCLEVLLDRKYRLDDSLSSCVLEN